jgi:ribulose 1,5-bisphosphate synthetase/thiazole synthase
MIVDVGVEPTVEEKRASVGGGAVGGGAAVEDGRP